MTMAPRSVHSSRARRGDGCTSSSDIAGDYSEAICENRRVSAEKKIVIIAGPNGAGKTTFAREWLPREAGCPLFINADLIAAGLSPFNPDAAAFPAGRLMLEEIDRNAATGISFAFETTLSGHTDARRISKWRSEGFRVKLVFLSLPTADDAIARVSARVQHGGHNVPADVIRKRFASGLRNFLDVYRDLVDSWQWIDNSIPKGVLLEEGTHDE
jgi:predicted ABC-type ATPase